MLSLLDIAERTMKGPKVEEKAWNLGHFRKMQELVQKYGIKYPGDGRHFNHDEGLLEPVFQAALEYLCERGVYCLTTGRVVQVSRQDVLNVVRQATPEVRVGSGRDVRVLKKRSVLEKQGLNHMPAHHAPFSEEMAPLAVKNFAMLASADLLEGFNFRVVDGREVFGMPLEAYAARRQVAWMREGIRKAGRPGMCIAFYPISTRASVLVAPMDPDYGLRRTDGILLNLLPDVKMETDMLAAAIVYSDYGAFTRGGASGMAGGFCGGVGGAVIEAICRLLGMAICYGGGQFGPVSITRISGRATSAIVPDPEVAWGNSLALQVLGRFYPVPTFNGEYTDSGPGTLTQLLELAYNFCRGPVNGANVTHTRIQRAQVDHALTPFEAEWVWELGQAVMRSFHTLDEAEAFYTKLGGLINGRVPELAHDVREVYDWVHHRPSSEYYQLYLRAKEMLAGIGLNFG